MGKLMRNGIEYAGGNGTDIFEVTQAEYDALKQAGTLVHNALYVITDAPNLNPTADDIEYQSGVTVADKLTSLASGKADKCKLVWSGNKYQVNDTMQISDWDNNKFYVIETIGFTGQGWHNFSLVYGGYANWQVGFWGDNTQYCRYRLNVSNTGLVTIFDVLNSASNTAIVGIYAIG